MDRPLTHSKDSHFIRLLGCGLFLILLICCPPARGSDDSHRLVKQGAALLEERDFVGAIAKFDEALLQDARDSQAVFFRAAALNRLGRFKEALKDLAKSEKMGTRHPDLAFERGWAYLHLKRWKEAVNDLDAYATRHPNRALAHEFLGRALYRLGQLKKAAKHFEKAIKLDSESRRTAGYHLALIEAKLNTGKSPK